MNAAVSIGDFELLDPDAFTPRSVVRAHTFASAASILHLSVRGLRTILDYAAIVHGRTGRIALRRRDGLSPVVLLPEWWDERKPYHG